MVMQLHPESRGTVELRSGDPLDKPRIDLNLLSTPADSAEILAGTFVGGPAALLGTGGAIWLTNVLAFALLYWELDGGGPGARVTAATPPDLAFAQQQSPQLAPRGWRPEFGDYLFVAFTTGTSFGPTDVSVLTPRMKVAVMTQAGVALVVVVLVVARAVNVLA